jgi:hypothetical protein
MKSGNLAWRTVLSLIKWTKELGKQRDSLCLIKHKAAVLVAAVSLRRASRQTVTVSAHTRAVAPYLRALHRRAPCVARRTQCRRQRVCALPASYLAVGSGDRCSKEKAFLSSAAKRGRERLVPCVTKYMHDYTTCLALCEGQSLYF